MSTQLKNVSPLGDLLIPGIGLVPHNGTFTTDDESLIANTDSFEAVPSTVQPVASTASPTSAVAAPTSTQE